MPESAGSTAMSDAPLLVRVMYLNVAGWALRRARGRQRFVREMTTVAVISSVVLTTAVTIDAWRQGLGIAGFLSGDSLVLLATAIAIPLLLRPLASTQWRLIEGRYACELAQSGRTPSPVRD